MTDKKRIEILEKAKIGINSNHYWYICEALNDLLLLKPVFRVFPELKKYKPENRRLEGAWWALHDKKSRIKVLNKLITEIKSKSND